MQTDMKTNSSKTLLLFAIYCSNRVFFASAIVTHEHHR